MPKTEARLKTPIELDEEALAAAARELGTTTKKDTVNAALRLVAQRGERVTRLLEESNPLFGGPDLDNPEIMLGARR